MRRVQVVWERALATRSTAALTAGSYVMARLVSGSNLKPCKNSMMGMTVSRSSGGRTWSLYPSRFGRLLRTNDLSIRRKRPLTAALFFF
jgi:hypothetical protein